MIEKELLKENKQLKAKVKELTINYESADNCCDYLSKKIKETEQELAEYTGKYLDVCGELYEKDHQIAILKSSEYCLASMVKNLQQQLRDQKQQIVEQIMNLANKKADKDSGMLDMVYFDNVLYNLLKDEAKK